MSIGILAYGSLIDDPGFEIKGLISKKLNGILTPFKIEFARCSSSLGGAPTLVPVQNGGSQVNAVIFILRDEVSLSKVKDRLYRRELHKEGDLSIKYKDYISSEPNNVRIIEIKSFNQVDTVLYICIQSNIHPENITASYLASKAIASVCRASKGEDGISYLLNAKRNGIMTPLLPDYEAEVLRQTGTNSLEEALKEMESRRKNDKWKLS